MALGHLADLADLLRSDREMVLVELVVVVVVVTFEERQQLNRFLISFVAGDVLLSHLILSWSRHAKVWTGEELITLSLVGRGQADQTCEILRSC